MRLILASASPRRQSLLRDAGYAFTTSPADIDEDRYPKNLMPAQVAELLERLKQPAAAAALSEPDRALLFEWWKHRDAGWRERAERRERDSCP